MPFEAEFLRKSVERRARQARVRGEIQEHRFPVRPQGMDDVTVRDNARFQDITGLALWAHLYWGGSWGG